MSDLLKFPIVDEDRNITVSRASLFERFRDILHPRYSDDVVEAYVDEAIEKWRENYDNGEGYHYEIPGRVTRSGNPTIEAP